MSAPNASPNTPAVVTAPSAPAQAAPDLTTAPLFNGGLTAGGFETTLVQLPQIVYRTLASVDGLRGEVSGLRIDLSGRLGALEQKMESHVTYREFSAAEQASKDNISSLSERITAMEEWRIAEINRRTEQLQQLQQQVGQANTSLAQSETRMVNTTSAHVIEINRTTLQYAVTILGILLSAILAHNFWR